MAADQADHCFWDDSVIKRKKAHHERDTLGSWQPDWRTPTGRTHGKEYRPSQSVEREAGQEKFILPATYSLIVTPASPETSWERVAVVEDRVVGFIDANLDTDPDTAEALRACIWRIFVDSDVQGQGVGSFLIYSFAEAAALAGIGQVTVIWEPGTLGPGAAFHRIGFTDIGQTSYGEIIGALRTPPRS